MSENEFINELMGFNPTDLSIFNEEKQQSTVNNLIYKTNPKDSTAEDGHYHSLVRVLYNPFDVKNSIVKQVKYSIQDENGFLLVDSKLALNDRDCPIFKAWKQLWFSGDETKKDYARKMFNRTESQWVLVQVIEDDNKPAEVGKFKVMKLPKVVFDKMTAKMNPSADSKKTPVPLMDYLFGPLLNIDVTPGPDDPQHPERKQREISYNLCEFETEPYPIIKIDGEQLLTDEELDLVESYNTKHNAFLKARTEADRKRREEEMNTLRPRIVELYKKVVEYMKDNAPDVVDECSFHEWDEKTTERVNHWIEKVLNMENPTNTIVLETAKTGNTEVFDGPEEVESEDEGIDLPF